MKITNRIRFGISLILFVFLTLLQPNSQLYAEDTAHAFKSVTFRINLVTNTNRNLLHQYWKPLAGGEAAIEVNAHAVFVSSLDGEGEFWCANFRRPFADEPILSARRRWSASDAAMP